MGRATYKAFLPGLPMELIIARYVQAGGHEAERLTHSESSAALIANAFGAFLGERTRELPPLPRCEDDGWPAISNNLEVCVRFPWRGGRHPWLDVLVETGSHIIGIESKRYEPFRPKMPGKADSKKYFTHDWGRRMKGYESIRDDLRKSMGQWLSLDTRQLFKHAFGLRTAVHDGRSKYFNKTAVLYYLYAEPRTWAGSNRSVDPERIQRHRDEISRFGRIVAPDEVLFRFCTYRELLGAWKKSLNPLVQEHAAAVMCFFDENL
jgi:hypothetical protein